MPRKRLIIILIIVAIAAIGGYVIFQQVRNAQIKQAYDASSDKVADELLRALSSNDIKGTMKLFSTDLTANYSEEYWKSTLFSDLQGFSGTPALKSKGPVHPASSDEPNRYDPQLKQDATQYEYDFKLGQSTYRVLFVIFRQDNAWKVNEFKGGYLP